MKRPWLFVALAAALSSCGGGATAPLPVPLPVCEVPAGDVLIVHDWLPTCSQCGAETINGYSHVDLTGCSLPGSPDVRCVASTSDCPAEDGE